MRQEQGPWRRCEARLLRARGEVAQQGTIDDDAKRRRLRGVGGLRALADARLQGGMHQARRLGEIRIIRQEAVVLRHIGPDQVGDVQPSSASVRRHEQVRARRGQFGHAPFATRPAARTAPGLAGRFGHQRQGALQQLLFGGHDDAPQAQARRQVLPRLARPTPGEDEHQSAAGEIHSGEPWRRRRQPIHQRSKVQEVLFLALDPRTILVGCTARGDDRQDGASIFGDMHIKARQLGAVDTGVHAPADRRPRRDQQLFRRQRHADHGLNVVTRGRIAGRESHRTACAADGTERRAAIQGDLQAGAGLQRLGRQRRVTRAQQPRTLDHQPFHAQTCLRGLRSTRTGEAGARPCALRDDDGGRRRLARTWGRATHEDEDPEAGAHAGA